MAQRPVKIVMSYWEELTASNPTHPTVVTIRSGVTRDGRLTAREVRTVHASGAYGAMKPRSFLSTAHYVGGGYRVPNTSFEFLQVYTNTTPGGYILLLQSCKLFFSGSGSPAYGSTRNTILT